MPDEPKSTALPGSEPGKEGTQPPAPSTDKTAQVAGSQPGEKKEESLPWDKDPRWKSARKAEQQLQSMVKANDLESIDDLVELVETGVRIRGKQVDVDELDSLIEKAKTLDKYEAYWKDQEEHRKRGEEDPQDTIKRLDDERKAKNREEKDRIEREKQAEKAKMYAEAYDSEVKKLVGQC